MAKLVERKAETQIWLLKCNTCIPSAALHQPHWRSLENGNLDILGLSGARRSPPDRRLAQCFTRIDIFIRVFRELCTMIGRIDHALRLQGALRNRLSGVHQQSSLYPGRAKG